MFKNIYADMQQWESLLENSPDMDWTIVRPSRLTNGKETGNYRAQINHCPKESRKISRKDLADFVTQQIGSDQYMRQKVAVSY